jgi:hypothetical protein
LFKGYAVVLAPLFLLYRYRLRGGAGWWRGPLWGVAAASVALAPVLLIAGLRAVEEPLRFHAQRGLEIESSYASVVLIAHHVAHLAVAVTPGRETLSRDVFSSLNGALLALLPWLLGGLLAATYAVAWVRLRRDPTPDALLLLSMAAVAAFMIAFKALPTHYLLWLCPMAAVTLAGATSRVTRAGAALGLALGLGALIPLIWPHLRALDVPAIAVVVARNVSILATFILLLAAAWSAGRSTTRRVGTHREADVQGRHARVALAGR